MECPNCQYGMLPYDEPLSDEAKACPRCGHPLKDNDKENSQEN
ncbi:hypothetical protein LCGC14_0305520 [marine sediment metagenome]|uniref:Uncharacterized protein n=1 Tax=marine sediment metagenome TaxID=412755 RepID=A0A0F9WV10_9ZZZZ